MPVALPDWTQRPEQHWPSVAHSWLPCRQAGPPETVVAAGLALPDWLALGGVVWQAVRTSAARTKSGVRIAIS